MADAYDHVRERYAAKLKELNTGTVTLSRITRADPAPETPWIPGAATTVIYTLDAVVKGVSAEFVDDTTILATDLMVIASPRATNASTGAVVDIEPLITDSLAIDGETKTIKKVQPMPAAGRAARFNIFVAS